MDRELIGQGWPFPIKPDPNGKLGFLIGEDRIKQSIWIILSTAPGERLMLPDFGCGVQDLVFQPNTAALRGVVQQHVRDALVKWEPRIAVLDVRVETPPEGRNYLLVRIDYQVLANNSLYNLVYPFFLNEGAAG
jgi:phage baseplate assembly protein W